MSKTTMRDVIAIIQDEKDKWLTENSEDKIRDDVRKFMEKGQFNALLKICGFDMDYSPGRSGPYWRIDHCNNRSGNSLVGDAIREAAKENLLRMLGEFDRINQDELRQIREAAHKEYLAVYKRVVKDEAKKIAEKHAREFIQAQITTALSGDAELVRLALMDTK